MLFANDISLKFGDRLLFKDASLSLLEGERVALVGHNGAGKSTLLKVLAGEVKPDSGKVDMRVGTRVGVLLQEPQLNLDSTVLECLHRVIADWLVAIARHATLCEQLSQPIDADTSAKLQVQLERLTGQIEHFGGFDTAYRIERVLNMLGVRARQEKVGTLSGGERRRVDLACLLLSAPDVYLLDEPTNHLDVNAIAFLRDTLKSSNSPVLFISHDRQFIDETATKIIELDKGQFYTHPVPYAQFVENMLIRQDINLRTAHKRERVMVRELAWLRAGTPARTTKQKARIDRASELIEQVSQDFTDNQERLLRVQQAKAGRLAKIIVELKDVGYSIGDRQLFQHVNLGVVEGERYGIVGPNGVGKTTLLKLITGQLIPTSGEVKIGLHTAFAIFDQTRATLRPDDTLKQTLADHGDTVFIGEERIHIASYLERILFDPSDMNRRVSTLSGGEQNRLLLAKLLKNPANCLILDEPTNDLDLASLGVLEELVQKHKGVAFVVSHDRTFLDRICTGIIAFEDTGEVVVYQGNYSTYLRLKAQHGAPEQRSVQPARVPVEAPKNKRKRSYNEEREYQNIEKQIAEAEDKKDKLSRALEDGSLYQKDPKQAKATTQELALLQTDIESFYARWQELEELGQS